MDPEVWLRELEAALVSLIASCGSVEGDLFHSAHWLLLRCRDNYVYTGELREASMRVLVKDVANFVEEYPGVLPETIANAEPALPRPRGYRGP